MRSQRTAPLSRLQSHGHTTYRPRQPSPVGEIGLTWLMLLFTLSVFTAACAEALGILVVHVREHAVWLTVKQGTFIAIVAFLTYGSIVYQCARIGGLQRRRAHRPAPRGRLHERIFGRSRRLPLTILVPSYKEDTRVIRQTLLSAALQEFPDRRVVLLMDDPPHSGDDADRQRLLAARELPRDLQALFDVPASLFTAAFRGFQRRCRGSLRLKDETAHLALLYEKAACWFEREARRQPIVDHTDRFFAEQILLRRARTHRAQSRLLAARARHGGVDAATTKREYERLAALFRVTVTSFERKRYVNLSHESNKAMNINSYVGLLGRSFREVPQADGVHLRPVADGPVDLRVPDAEFLITLDADSLLLPDYALRLVSYMNEQRNQRVAVAQTPYSAIPGAPGILERAAGATTDMQYIIHQGFTRYAATFWVGANALLRTSALRDIRVTKRERGFAVPVYIQDRTVIEDTESTVDLIRRGWQLYNYPARLAYSATPPDFGSLLIQRRRWANGGLIILPKLLRYLFGRPLRVSLWGEGMMRIHYLSSITGVNLGLLMLLLSPFEESLRSVWLPLTAVPYFFLYGRDLLQRGYRLGDLLRVYALNLILIPVNLGGVVKSLHQAWTGMRIPFTRTPKVRGRTGAPALYVAAEYALVGSMLFSFAVDFSHGRFAHAAFSLANAAFFGYALIHFIGLADSAKDLLSQLNGFRLSLRRYAFPSAHLEAE
jgi:cellulose synthase/poly-beta-1,6-N-acetylglucosamine synthase-like glycosyltransferase